MAIAFLDSRFNAATFFVLRNALPPPTQPPVKLAVACKKSIARLQYPQYVIYINRLIAILNNVADYVKEIEVSRREDGDKTQRSRSPKPW